MRREYEIRSPENRAWLHYHSREVLQVTRRMFRLRRRRPAVAELGGDGTAMVTRIGGAVSASREFVPLCTLQS